MKKTLILMALPLAWSLTAPAYAQTEKTDPPKPPAQAQGEQKKEEPKKEEPKKDPKIEEYEKAIKDLTKIEGQFNFYLRKKDVLLEVSEEQLGKMFFIQATLNTGASSVPLQAGDPVGNLALDPFYFERKEDQLWLMRPNLKYRWSPKDPLAIASARTFPTAILSSFRIEQQHPEKKLLLINATPLFYGDIFRLAELVQAGAMGQYMLDRDKSGPEKVKSFPENANVQMRLHFFSPRGNEPNPLMILLGLGGPSHLEDSRSLPLKVTYNLWYRKESDYMPRLADPRVGYFTQDFFSLDRFLSDDRTERYIMRFNLKKKDPSAKLSEPVKPIVWTIDHSVPPQYREAVKAGLLRWNKAFELLGYKDAVQVQNAPDDPEWDHADGRYNVVRWSISPDSGYAIAIPRWDPFTGEILNAGITLDANMLSFAENEHQMFATPSAGGPRALSVLLRDNTRPVTPETLLFGSERENAMAGLRKEMVGKGWTLHQCAYAHGLTENAAFSWNALQANPHGIKISKEEYARQFISDVISHEAGHCLGLRHNFVGSTNLTTQQLADDRLTSEQNVSASVMDYTPVNIMAVLRGHGNFFAPTIGAYDKWAVQYGYTESKATTPSGEKHALSLIAAQSTKPGHGFMTDENADSWDPYVARFDNARDPLNHSEKMLQAAARMRTYAIRNLPRPGESYAKRTRLIMGSVAATIREGRMAARFVGGISSNRNFRGPEGPRPTLAPVDPAEQRRAVRLIAKHVLSDDSFALPEDVLQTLSIDPDSNPGWNAPLRDYIGMRQNMVYALLMSADTTDRIAENSYKWGEKPGAYTMDEHYASLLGAVFREVGQNKTIPPLRRDLQRFAITGLITQAGAPQGAVSEDVRVVASDALKRLAKRFGEAAAQSSKLDGMTQAHLRDTKDAIERFLNRQHGAR
ncbi:MAG TPA: zinc-dependent metalloprotease [Fimbriimonadaceae bacterium]|nr:zinc-dependent metalloprotease [Fimbriimonadaceae bacterium]